MRTRYILFLACLAVVGGLAGWAVSRFAGPDGYRASALVTAQRSAPSAQLFEFRPPPGYDRGSFLRLNAELVTTDPVVKRVNSALPTVSERALLDAVRVRELRGALMIEGTADSRQLAAQIANAFADAFVAYRREREQSQISQTGDAVQAQIAALGPRDSERRERLEATLAELDARSRLATGGFVVVGGAAAATAEPVNRDPVPWIASGALLALAIGGTVLALWWRRSYRLRGTRSIERALDMSLVGTLPRSSALDAGAPNGIPEDDAAAFSQVVDALVASGAGRDWRTLAIASPKRFDGRTTIAWQLARTFAGRGVRAVYVEADMMNPALAERLGLESGQPGLAAVLTGRAAVGDAVVAVDGEPDAIFAGATFEHPEYLLKTSAFAGLLRELAASYDVVLVDIPSGPAAREVRSAVDRMLVLARAARLTAGEAARFREDAFDAGTAGAPALGVAVNAVERP